MNWADKEYCIGRGLAALTTNSEICLPEYVYHFVKTQTLQMLSLAAGSTFPNLPGAKLKSLEIPLPPQAETGTELDALLPAVLDKAFKGEL